VTIEVGSSDGYGNYGVLERRGRELICHECGRAHRHLGLHVYRAHGLRASEYRKRHGLARGRGLVAEDLRAVIQANAIARMNQVGGQAFILARNPATATRARLANWEGFAPQTHSEQAIRTANSDEAPDAPGW
jgi:hypothetical protein